MDTPVIFAAALTVVAVAAFAFIYVWGMS